MKMLKADWSCCELKRSRHTLVIQLIARFNILHNMDYANQNSPSVMILLTVLVVAFSWCVAVLVTTNTLLSLLFNQANKDKKIMSRSQKKRLKSILDLCPRHVKREAKAAIQDSLPGMEHPVSRDDLRLWVSIFAPRISECRLDRYAASYNVSDKIRRAKSSGKWPPKPAAMQYG